MSNTLAPPGCEAPNAAAPDSKAQHNDKRCGLKSEDFADKLKQFKNECTDKVKPHNKEGDVEEKDNGMHDKPDDCMVYGVVGILEGFEPPSYQPDSEAIITTEGVLAPAPAEGKPQQMSGEQGQLIQTATQGEDKSALSEQIAWMLNTDEAGTGPVQTQEEVLQIVGEHLDSLENTSKELRGITPEAKSAIAGDSVIKQPDMTAKESAGMPLESAGMPLESAGMTIADEAKSVDPKSQGTASVISDSGTDKAEAQYTGSAVVKKSGDATEAGELQTTGLSEDAAAVNANAVKISAEPETSVPETPRPESVRESVLRIVDKVSVKAAEGKYDFDIDLKPDFMGKVSIKLTMEDGAVKVHIRADDAAVKGMLQDQTSSLQSMLKEKGIPVSNIDVTYEGSQAQGNEGHARNGEGRQHQSNLFREQAENGSYESARERYDFYLGNSSIEYLA